MHKQPRRKNVHSSNAFKFSSSRLDSHQDQKTFKKVFMGGIPQYSTKHLLVKYLSRYGEVENIFLPKTKRGTLKGFCIIRFKRQATVEKVLRLKEVEIEGKIVSLKPCLPIEDAEQQKKNSEELKIFVSGIEPESCEREIKDFFSSFGSIDHFRIILDPRTGIPRGFGYLKTRDLSSYRYILDIYQFKYESQTLTAEPSHRRSQNMNDKSFQHRRISDYSPDRNPSSSERLNKKTSGRHENPFNKEVDEFENQSIEGSYLPTKLKDNIQNRILNLSNTKPKKLNTNRSKCQQSKSKNNSKERSYEQQVIIEDNDHIFLKKQNPQNLRNKKVNDFAEDNRRPQSSRNQPNIGDSHGRRKQALVYIEGYWKFVEIDAWLEATNDIKNKYRYNAKLDQER